MDYKELETRYNKLFLNCIESHNGKYNINDTQLGAAAVALMEKCNRYPKISYQNRKKKIVVSLTSIKKRLKYVCYPIKCMLMQSMLPDRIILWLDENIREDELPHSLTELKKNGLEIRFVDDIGPHTKYFYALQEFQNDCVITIDDDMLYQLDMIEGLMETHKKYPHCVCTYIPIMMKYTENGVPYPLSQCRINQSDIEVGELNLAQGVCGILYPPSCIDKKFFDKQLIRKLCFKQDDIWLYVAEYLSGVKIARVNASAREYPYVEGAQVTALRYSNQREGNITYFYNIFEYFKLYQEFQGINKIENENKTRVFMKWVQLLQRGYRVSDYLKQKGVKNVSLYGFGQLGKLLYKELVDDGIEIHYIIDNYAESSPFFVLKRNEEVDMLSSSMLIITAPVETNYVKKNIRCTENCLIMSLMDILIELEYLNH